MTENRMTAFCGVDCAQCTDYTGGRCPSCRETEWKDGDVCMPVSCCREKGIAFCGLCDGFPCLDMAEFYEESESHRAAYRRMCALKEERTD